MAAKLKPIRSFWDWIKCRRLTLIESRKGRKERLETIWFWCTRRRKKRILLESSMLLPCYYLFIYLFISYLLSIYEPGKHWTSFFSRGISVRMGIHAGKPVCELDPTTDRMDYFGPVVNRAARVSGVADGGEIFISSEAMVTFHLSPFFIFSLFFKYSLPPGGSRESERRT